MEDNIGVRKVVLDYWYDDEEPRYVDITMNRSFEIEIRQDDVQSLHYRFKAEDEAGNVAVTSNRTVQVIGGETGIEFDGETDWTRGLPIFLIIGFSSLFLILGVFLVIKKKKRKEDETENKIVEKTDIIRPVKESMYHHEEFPIKSPGRGSLKTLPGSSIKARPRIADQGVGGKSRVTLLEDGRKKPMILKDGISTEVCNICLGGIKHGSPTKSRSQCGKMFHKPCAMRLKECPICGIEFK